MIRAVLVSALLLCACAPQAQTYRDLDQVGRDFSDRAASGRTAEDAAADTCGMSRFRHLIGAPASELDQTMLPPGARIITPDTMVTQDFSPQRLNIITGTDGLVSSLRCF